MLRLAARLYRSVASDCGALKQGVVLLEPVIVAEPAPSGVPFSRTRVLRYRCLRTAGGS